jgi:hypothetical protein
MADQTQPLTPQQAQQLAQEFHDIAAAIGAYRLAKVDTLTSTQQYQLQNQQMQCVQYSNTFITAGLFAAQADLATTLQTIKQQTTLAAQAISTLKTVDKVLQIVTAAAVLGASIASLNPSAVASGIQGLVAAITGPAANTTGAAGAALTQNAGSAAPTGGS